MFCAVPVTRRLLRQAETVGLVLDVVDILPLQATAFHGQSQTAQALRVLKRALTLTESEGHVRMFLECGEPMAQLLRLVAASAPDQEIADKLGPARPTVKTQLRHIYRKLQVGRRTQAIVRARLLRLLP